MALSFVEYPGDGVTQVYAVPFDFLYQIDVNALVDGKVVNFTWVGPNTIRLEVAPQSGQILKIQRDTEKRRALVDFKNDSILDEALLDLMWKQIFMIVQEAQDLTGVSYSVSSNARSIASTARSIAQAAEAKAATASSKADSAVATGNTAISTANSAASTAASAVSTANNAVAAAGAAQSTANSAVSTANSAVSTASEARTSATNATNTARQASDAAAQAQNTADLALNRAVAAEASASASRESALSAQTAAEAASAGAEAATVAAAQALTTTEQIRQDVIAITGADFTDFVKNSDNLAALVNKEAARVNLGLGMVDNTRDVDKPISTAVQGALVTKAPLDSPVFTGSPTAPTPPASVNDSTIATTAHVKAVMGLFGLADPATQQAYHTGNWWEGTDKVFRAVGVTGVAGLDLATASIFDLTLAGNTTLTVNNLPALNGEARSIVVRVTQGATAYTLTWWEGITWLAPSTPTAPAAGKVQEYVLTWDGSTWVGRPGAKN